MVTLSNELNAKIQSTDTMKSCQVCGDRAFLFNYGALSCSPCRTFFRRNAFRPKTMRACCYSGQCEINIVTRKLCPTCRLKKCFTVGMCPELIRKEELSTKKRKYTPLQTEKSIAIKIPKESALDHLPGRTNIILNSYDRTLISNVVHAFDAYSPVLELRRIMERLKTFAPGLEYNEIQGMQLMSSCYKCINSFISSIPDFKILTLTEQRSLRQRNLMGLFFGGLVCIGYESGIFEKPENEPVFSLLYGSEATQQTKSIFQKHNGDPILIKLLLVAAAFSSNCYMVENRMHIEKDCLLFGTFRLLGSQNAYVEIIWKYLVYTYGFRHTVELFSKLIKQLLDTFSVSIYLYQNCEFHRHFLDSITKDIETCSIVNEKDLVPLWGKPQ